jgi:hypothetical protein
MTRIFKYPLLLTSLQTIDMPTDALCLRAGEQDGELMLWAAVDPELPYELRQIQIVATGQTMRGSLDNWNYIDTVQMVDGDVYHIFQEDV